MKIRRRIQLAKQHEFYEIEEEFTHGNTLHIVAQMEKDAKDIEDFLLGNIRLPKTPQKTETPTSSEPRAEGTPFNRIDVDTKDFNLINVEITKVYPVKSGTRKTDGTEWVKQSLMIKDVYGEERELVAWGDHTEKFENMLTGYKLTIMNVSKVTEYKDKLQFVIGSTTEVLVQ